MRQNNRGNNGAKSGQREGERHWTALVTRQRAGPLNLRREKENAIGFQNIYNWFKVRLLRKTKEWISSSMGQLRLLRDKSLSPLPALHQHCFWTGMPKVQDLGWAPYGNPLKVTCLSPSCSKILFFYVCLALQEMLEGCLLRAQGLLGNAFQNSFISIITSVTGSHPCLPAKQLSNCFSNSCFSR